MVRTTTRTIKVRTQLISATTTKGEFIQVTADSVATARIPFPKALGIPSSALFEVGTHAREYFFTATISNQEN